MAVYPSLSGRRHFLTTSSRRRNSNHTNFRKLACV
jgi:hypothetical protein